MAWLLNYGEMPDECIVRDEDGNETGRYHRVIVRLRNGTEHGREPVSTTAPKGWDPRTTRWKLSDHAYDILEFQLA